MLDVDPLWKKLLFLILLPLLLALLFIAKAVFNCWRAVRFSFLKLRRSRID